MLMLKICGPISSPTKDSSLGRRKIESVIFDIISTLHIVKSKKIFFNIKTPPENTLSFCVGLIKIKIWWSVWTCRTAFDDIERNSLKVSGKENYDQDNNSWVYLQLIMLSLIQKLVDVCIGNHTNGLVPFQSCFKFWRPKFEVGWSLSISQWVSSFNIPFHFKLCLIICG